jgi:hypothetical protein
VITLNCWKNEGNERTLYWSKTFTNHAKMYVAFDLITDRLREKGSGWEVEVIRA